MGNQSEVARLLGEIDERNQAARRGLSDFAATSNHEAIIKRIEQGANPVLQLFAQGRGADAIRLWEKWVDAQLQANP